ncbi:acyltransferase family protein [Peribacillus simplex]|uniref:acyltransferase family protein n=1 Tax=Peribacillus simplex TaxID=1478 RepID=UPI003334EFC3
MVVDRDLRIDALRFVGTMLVILAHVGAPNWIQNIRTFDVVMLVLISGMSINKSRDTKKYFNYLFRRLKKMVFPLYIVLTIIFVINFVMSSLFGISSTGLDFNIILESYLLLDGIGYVWVVRVFLCVALVAPFFPRLFKNRSSVGFISIVVISYILYSTIGILLTDNPYWLFDFFFMQIVPYILIAAIGYKIYINKEMTKLMLLVSIIGLFGITITNIILNQSILPDSYKYPPQLQYLFYGLFISLLLFLIVDKFKSVEKFFASKFINFVSINSYDIYLYHILTIFIYNALKKLLGFNISNEYIVKYVFVLSIAIVLVIIKNYLKRYFNEIVNHYKNQKAKSQQV